MPPLSHSPRPRRRARTGVRPGATLGALGGVLCGVLCGGPSGVSLAAQVPVAGATAATAITGGAGAGSGAAVRALVAAGRHPAMRWGHLDDVAADLRSLYPDGGALLWSAGGRPTPPAVAMVGALTTVDRRGLRPDDYDAAALARLAAAPVLTPADQASFDVALSAAAARVVRALALGRVRPATMHPGLRIRFADPELDVPAAVAALARDSAPGRALDALEPPFLHYRLLAAALARYRALATADSAAAPVTVGTPLRPGGRDAGVPRLRRLLVTLGDLPNTAPVGDSLAYDPALADAVRAFQRRQGAEPDGVVGAGTLGQLRRPFDDRVTQIALTLERWRWLPRAFSEPPVIVNVPAFRLHAFRSSSDREADLLSMDVVVGDAFDSRTPVFSDQLEYLVFSPYWDVPPSIARGEIVPKARRDAGYLERGNYEVVAPDGRVLGQSPAAVAALAAGRARVRQRPGPANALGRVKFIFPNDHAVYLHDSPAQAVFARARRDASHGCVRVAEPARLAAFLLRDQPAWDSARVAAALQGTAPRQVNLRTRVPVHLVYATAVAREDGRVFFYDDIYGHDRALARALDRGYPYR